MKNNTKPKLEPNTWNSPYYKNVTINIKISNVYVTRKDETNINKSKINQLHTGKGNNEN